MGTAVLFGKNWTGAPTIVWIVLASVGWWWWTSKDTTKRSVEIQD